MDGRRQFHALLLQALAPFLICCSGRSAIDVHHYAALRLALALRQRRVERVLRRTWRGSPLLRLALLLLLLLLSLLLQLLLLLLQQLLLLLL